MKRPRDAFDTPAPSSPLHPSAKRRQPNSQSMMASGSSPAAARCQTTPYSLPSACSIASPWSSLTPHDSPSNPFGLARELQALALPRPSGFAKHIVLRMQMVPSTAEAPSRSRRLAADAPYRLVQVPLNYTIRHLHMLVLFLFASDARLRVRRRRRVFSPTSVVPRQRSPPKRGARTEMVFGESPRQDEGHVFEVLENIAVYSSSYRPGVIIPGSGKCHTKLSSTRERKLFPDGYKAGDDDDEEDVFGSPKKPGQDQDDSEEEDWDWEAEDDYSLSNIWPEGPDLTKGIIYHHTPSLAIHITVNTSRVESRRGTGNTPYVFAAHGGTNGAVRIANVARGPAPPHSAEDEPIRRGKDGKKRKAATFADLEYFEVDDLADTADADVEERERWNDEDSFARFLRREAERERAMRRADAQTPSTGSPVKSSSQTRPLFSPTFPVRPVPSSQTSFAARAPAASSSKSQPAMFASAQPLSIYTQRSAASSSTSLAPSSPSTLPCAHATSDFDGDSEDHANWSEGTPSSEGGNPLAFDDDDDDEEDGEKTRRVFRIELPTTTPFPAHPRARRRVARACARIERQTSKGLSELSDSDEEAEAEVEAEAEDAESEETKKQPQSRAKLAPPVVAADVRDPVTGSGGAQAAAAEDDDWDSEDEQWDAGQTWFQPPVADGSFDWDSEEEV
ncbi:uncharacterized protein BXZ73DRAFT_98409 [Epithele typhae]|uniref:uncharacterized protein n=1 Tax=Epithele typhae TaxID=378194 RepID=UPI002007894B|nr:uncharacterized protein BXZ73DRAFT_98409 [Epithele typhae]KAH9941194.1 hypothetical protein BXZ73DRAFT_98409 [Epithele typhae]